MKKYLKYMLLSCLLYTGVYAQQTIPIQAKPLENILISFKSDSVALFANSFSKEIDSEEIKQSKWKERLNEGKEKFKKRFGDYQIQDFSFKYVDSTSQLQVFFRNKEAFKVLVIEEDSHWKLKEH
ncbi:hypothetical protein [Ascidiimonas sp. W6]|uniref:hypothetical protein n=1 Tax=Ascidiimonas meishanensis TaxID=3128903 RepID=UPI0030ED31B4